jgi:bla regulator protein BlaR1
MVARRWLGARMVDERERACDEEVLRAGSQAQAYAEGILKVCEFYLESPLTCVSSVTGSDLKKRIQRIMREHFGTALSTRKKWLLATVAVAALIVPVMEGIVTAPRVLAQSAAARPSFEAASIKINKNADSPPGTSDGVPGSRFKATAVTLPLLLYAAYDLPESRMSGLPVWADDMHFDVEAVAAGSPSAEEKRLMLQSLLADRFQLTAHHEMRRLPAYALVVAKPGKLGPQLHAAAKCDASATASAAADAGAPAPGACREINFRGTSDSATFEGRDVTIDEFIPFLVGFGSNRNVDKFGINQYSDRPIIDHTGLTGRFDFTLTFARLPGNNIAAASTTAPTLFTALQEQLGLKLEPQTGPVDVMVIDHVEQPSAN